MDRANSQVISLRSLSYAAGFGPDVDSAGNLQAHADPLGRICKKIAPDGSTTDTEYEGSSTTVTVRGIGTATGLLDATTAYRSDELGRLVSVDSPGTAADARYTYDEEDHLTLVELLDPSPNAGLLT